MPPSTQGSRAALITWTVITSILFVTATILAIIFYSGKTKAEEAADTVTKKYNDVVREASLSGPDIGALKQARSEDTARFSARTTLLDVALAQRNALAQKITGVSDATERAALERAEAALQSAASGGTPPPSLVAAIDTLKQQLTDAASREQQLKQQVAQLDADKKSLRQKAQAEAEQLQAAVRAADERAKKAEAALAAVTTDKDTAFTALSDQMQQQSKVAQEAQAAAAGQVTELQARIRALQKEIAEYQQRLANLRIPTHQLLRQADGRVVRTPGQGLVFIDLGRGDQVSAGMTFEVFDRLEGVPAAGSDENNDPMPRGKASIEVIRVQPGSAEARIIRLSPGQTITEGDLLVNLVYDRNTRYNFVIHGKFDLDRNGVATANDTEVIKRLVTQWGGSVHGEVGVNTDFLVLGIQPELPNYSQEDLSSDPILRARYDQAQAELDAYERIRERAAELNIPILNQNRFLYLVGYFEQAAR